MIAKKNNKADLERKRFAFFQIGLLISGSLCLAAFEYATGTPDEKIVQYEPPVFEFTPDMEKDYQVIENKVVNVQVTKNLDNIKVVDKITKDGDVKVTDKDGDITFDEDGGDLSFNWNIVEEKKSVITYEFAEVEPQFPGGDVALMQWMQENVVYPTISAQMGVQGMAYVKFVVKSNGKVADAKIIQSTGDEDLDKEALRVVGKMPTWIPGEQAGKKVNVFYTIPINFVLR